MSALESSLANLQRDIWDGKLEAAPVETLRLHLQNLQDKSRTPEIDQRLDVMTTTVRRLILEKEANQDRKKALFWARIAAGAAIVAAVTGSMALLRMQQPHAPGAEPQAAGISAPIPASTPEPQVASAAVDVSANSPQPTPPEQPVQVPPKQAPRPVLKSPRQMP